MLFLLGLITLSLNENTKPEIVIGIDLGTTYSCVGVLKDGKVEIMPNEQGNRITPSYVAFTKDGRLVGDSAKNQIALNPENTIFDAKRLVGRSWNDASLQSDLPKFPFKVKNKNDRAVIEVNVSGEIKEYSPEEISGMVLSKMKETAEKYLGKPVKDAIITVPAYFNDGQRQATKDAGTIAGLNVLRIINEPTAAAISFGVENKKKEINVLVYDLGGGTFDVTLLTIDDGVFEVLSTSGDTHLGGEDFDHRILEHFVEIIKKKYKTDIRGDHSKLMKLKREVEKAKRTLSSQHIVTIEIEGIAPGKDFEETLSRARMEELNSDLFKQTLIPVENVLKEAKISKDQVDEIILVGGSTRIPKIKQLVKDFFNGKAATGGVNPDEAVAWGASYQGGVFTGYTADVVLLDVTPLSLGIETMGGVFSKLIEKNTVVPTKKTNVFTTAVDNQPGVDIKVFQGEREKTEHNSFIGEFHLSGIPPAPRGSPQIEVTFEIDTNGILTVLASEKSSGKSEKKVIESTSTRLSQKDIDAMVKDAADFAEEDKLFREKTETYQRFEGAAYQLNSQLKDEAKLGGKLSPEDKKTLLEETESALKWLTENKGATVEVIKQRLADFEKIVHPITSKLGDADANSSEEL